MSCPQVLSPPRQPVVLPPAPTFAQPPPVPAHEPSPQRPPPTSTAAQPQLPQQQQQMVPMHAQPQLPKQQQQAPTQEQTRLPQQQQQTPMQAQPQAQQGEQVPPTPEPPTSQQQQQQQQQQPQPSPMLQWRSNQEQQLTEMQQQFQQQTQEKAQQRQQQQQQQQQGQPSRASSVSPQSTQASETVLSSPHDAYLSSRPQTSYPVVFLRHELSTGCCQMGMLASDELMSPAIDQPVLWLQALPFGSGTAKRTRTHTITRACMRKPASQPLFQSGALQRSLSRSRDAPDESLSQMAKSRFAPQPQQQGAWGPHAEGALVVDQLLRMGETSLDAGGHRTRMGQTHLDACGRRTKHSDIIGCAELSKSRVAGQGECNARQKV
eukprot:1161734-Pelagomonas_calceolata.AAC.16